MQEFEENEDRILAISCRRNAERFSADRFCTGLRQIVQEAMLKRLEPEVASNVLVLTGAPATFTPQEKERAVG